MSLEASMDRLAAAMESIAKIMVDGQSQLNAEIAKVEAVAPTRNFPSVAAVAPSPIVAPAVPTTASVTPINLAPANIVNPSLDATRNALATFAKMSKENAIKVQASLTAMNAQKLSDLDEDQRGTLLTVLGITA